MILSMMIYKTKLPLYHYIENKTKHILNINIIKESILWAVYRKKWMSVLHIIVKNYI